MCTLRIQLIATAPGAALFLDTPSELRRVCVVKTPMAPPKKCYKEKQHHYHHTGVAGIGRLFNGEDNRNIATIIYQNSTFKALHVMYGT